jgi:hypothetical protein
MYLNGDSFKRQSAFDENHLAIGAPSNPLRIEVQRFNP